MTIKHTEYTKQNNNTFISSSNIAHVYAQSWAPENANDVKAIFQISHGMAEYSDRYEDFGKFMAEHGYAVFINDHVGHGKSIEKDDQLGYFGRDDDCGRHLVEDIHTMTKIAKKEYPNVPVVLFGHSMGSFVARNYLARYGNEIKCSVICGTAGPNPATGLGLMIVKILEKIKGPKYRSAFIDNLAFGTYNKKFAVEGDNGFSWLSANKDNVDKYNKDPLCGYRFTLSGFKGLFGNLSDASEKIWYENVPSDLPILLIAGEDDPVGGYGKGVKQVYEGLKEAGHGKVKLKLWTGLRHEILNEKTNKDVYEYILDWTDKNI